MVEKRDAGAECQGVRASKGRCRLCLKAKDLQNSHFIPQAFYRIVSRGANEQIEVTASTHISTSRQLTAHLLCDACEQRFHTLGEDWVLRNCWRSDGEFRLNATLRASTPLASNGSWAAYAAVPGVDRERLAFFAASVFWRSTLRGWSRVTEEENHDLGPYAEALRLFLLGDQSFPEGIVLLTLVNPSERRHRRSLRRLGWGRSVARRIASTSSACPESPSSCSWASASRPSSARPAPFARPMRASRSLPRLTRSSPATCSHSSGEGFRRGSWRVESPGPRRGPPSGRSSLGSDRDPRASLPLLSPTGEG